MDRIQMLSSTFQPSKFLKLIFAVEISGFSTSPLMAQLKQVWLTLGYAPGAEGCDISSSNKPLTWSVKKKRQVAFFYQSTVQKINSTLEAREPMEREE